MDSIEDTRQPPEPKVADAAKRERIADGIQRWSLAKDIVQWAVEKHTDKTLDAIANCGSGCRDSALAIYQDFAAMSERNPHRFSNWLKDHYDELLDPIMEIMDEEQSEYDRIHIGWAPLTEFAEWAFENLDV